MMSSKTDKKNKLKEATERQKPIKNKENAIKKFSEHIMRRLKLGNLTITGKTDRKKKE